MPWTESDMPDLSGKTVVVTGANSGLGFEGARAFAAAGAHVVLACRNASKAATAKDAILSAHPEADIEVMVLDLASLESVREFAANFDVRHDRLDVLCNNAGVMAIPRRETADGFEMQFGTNHLGHFALTGRLLDRLLATPGARVVNQSSHAHRFGKIRFDDLHARRRYRRWAAYGQSKLANLLFTRELARRAEARGLALTSVACHPGYSATELQFAGARMDGSALGEWIFGLGNRLLAQSAAMGALPMLYAAVAPDVRSGEYFGPGGFAGQWGFPRRVGMTAAARDDETARRLWEASEEATGVRYAPLSA